MTTNKSKIKQLFGIILLLAFLLMGCSSGGGDESTASSVSDDTAADTSSDATDDGSDTSDGGSTSDISNITMDSVGAPGELGGLHDISDLATNWDWVTNGDNWYWTKISKINDDGIVVGQSTGTGLLGQPTKAAFRFDASKILPDGPPPSDAPEEDQPQLEYLYIHSEDHISYDPEDETTNFIYSEAVDIGPDGDVIGNSTTGTGWPDEEEKRGFYWDDGAVVDLPPIDEGKFSEARFINAKYVLYTAEVAGEGLTPGKNAYYWNKIDNVWGGLGLIVGATLTEPVGINKYNQAVVNSEGSTAVFHDLDRGIVQSLNHLPEATATTAVAINDSTSGSRLTGHIAGTSGDHAFFWDGGVMWSCGDLGGGTSEAIDMNNSDILVGNSTTSDGSTHAFSWKITNGEGEMTDLGTLGGANSYATAINDNGWIVGYSETGETYEQGGISQKIVHACAWHDNVIYDLGTHEDFYPYRMDEPMPFSEAVDINENNQIAGNSYSANSHFRGFVINAVAP